MSPRRIFSWVTLLLFLFSVRPVSAHGYIIRSIPEDRATLEHAPSRLQYWFSEGLEKQFSTLTVRDQAGNIVATGGVSENDRSLLTVTLPRGLADGAYIVDMRLAFSSDGHVVAQSVVFFVGKTSSDVSGTTASDQANGLEVIWRTFSLASTMLLFGTFTVYSLVLVPAWGNPAHRVGLLPPRVMRRLNEIVIGALIVGFLSGILALLQQTMVFFNADIGQSISQGLWTVVRIGTRFGDLWSARTFLMVLIAVLIGLSLYYREDQPEATRPTWTAGIWAGALIISTYSAGSHATGSLILPWIALINDWFHALAVGFWAGGLAALILVLPVALAPYEGDARRLALLAVLQRFSRLALICVVLVIATGIYSAVNWVYQPSDLTQTSYGGALILKLILVAGLLLFGLLHHIALRPERYEKWLNCVNRLTHIRVANHFISTLRLETLFVFLVLASIGLLSATPPPVPYFIRPSIPAPSATQAAGNYSVSLTLSPGGPGVNTYETTITRDGQPVDGLSVKLQWDNPNRDWRSGWETAENADSGLYITTGADIDRSGEWWSILNITDANGLTTRAAFDWQITDDASVQQSQPPAIQNILAMILVLIVLAWIAYPTARRIYATLDLSPATVTVAISAFIAMIIFLAVGILVIQNTQAQFEATLNPPPKAINTVLPDADSLLRGQQLYADNCPAWQKTNLNALIERLPRTRDDELYEATLSGWQGIPECAPTLSDEQRWDIVNYIRTFQNT